MESYGQWSAGKDNNAVRGIGSISLQSLHSLQLTIFDNSRQDPRLEGGYESVPTRDIHLKQVGLDQLWLYFLKVYIRPMQEKIYTGYVHDVSNKLGMGYGKLP